MALKKLIQLEGDTFLNTPHGNIKIGESKVDVTIHAKVKQVFASKENIEATVIFSSKEISFSKEYSFPASVVDGSPNYIKQAYQHLKTLPEFENSEDC